MASSFGPHPSHGWRRSEATTPAPPVYYGGDLRIPTAAKYLKGIARDWLARTTALGSFVSCEFGGGGRHHNGSALRPSLPRAWTLAVSGGSPETYPENHRTGSPLSTYWYEMEITTEGKFVDGWFMDHD